MAVTGSLSDYPRIGEVSISDWKAAGLLKASTLKPIITTLEKHLIIRSLGQLSHRDLSSLQTLLKTIVG